MNKKETHVRLIQLPLLVIYMVLINIIVGIVGHLLVPSYSEWYYSTPRVEDLFLIIVYAIGQILIFPIKRIRNIILFCGIHLLLGLLLLHNDISGYGWEICATYTFCISKINHLLGIMINNLLESPLVVKANVVLVFPIYLTCITLSFRWMYFSIKKRLENRHVHPKV